MMSDSKWSRLNPSEYNKLTEEEKFPKLISWFDITKSPKTIACWAFSGFGNNDLSISKRSPSADYWLDLIQDLKKLGFKINLYGHPKSQFLEDPGISDRRALSLFDAIKESLGCDLTITTDSGVSHLFGAYGKEQIVLYTNYMTNHISNLGAFLPMNWKNNLISCFGAGGINNISKLEVLEGVFKFTKL